MVQMTLSRIALLAASPLGRLVATAALAIAGLALGIQTNEVIGGGVGG